ALNMLESVYASVSDAFLPYAKADPDFEFLRGEPRYVAMIEAAEARLASAKNAVPPVATQPG
ncbi:MAG: hypothetical protein ACREPH_07035, partial [Rhodanobacteraceae bacterium]